jgi:arsenite-transporting ATPase
VARLAFFIGKGGVGKTTLAAACAVRSAHFAPRSRVLLVSTDPAHSLADVFQLTDAQARKLSRASKVSAAARNLDVWQIDATREFEEFLSRYREEILDVVESGTMFSRAEVEPLLSATLPGMAEISALIAIHAALAAGSYGLIVVDTAPMGHTLRLFEMPQYFLRFLDFLDLAGSRDQILAAHFGGGKIISHNFLEEWRQMLARVNEAFAGQQSKIFLVTTPETFSLNEAVRSSIALAEGAIHLKITDVVLNRAITRAAKSCLVCSERKRATLSAQKFIKRKFPEARRYAAIDSGAPIMGARRLLAFGEHVFDGKAAPEAITPRSALRGFPLEPTDWPNFSSPLTFTLGKGGVGKTTISASGALNSALKSNGAVTICSTDPAPSLSDIFRRRLADAPKSVLNQKNLFAAEFNGVAQFQNWAAHINTKLQRSFSTERRGVHVDLSFERRIFSALLEIVPPGVDELFAIFQILDLVSADGAGSSKRQLVIIDMAPTAHALELLRMPERILHWSRLLLKILARHRDLALAQDAAVEIAQIGHSVRALAEMLKNSKRAVVVPVMLAEPLPDRETGRLIRELRELGVKPELVFVNRVLMVEEPECRRCRVARAWQMATIEGLAHRIGFAGRLLFVPNFPHELTGRGGLQSVTHNLWQLAKPLRRSKSGAKPQSRRRMRR